MSQNYQIYINNTAVLLSDEPMKEPGESSVDILWDERKETLVKLIENFESTIERRNVTLYFSEFKKLKDVFFSLFLYLEAAGGLVKNEKEELLAIKRLGKWDLPKGKIESGESPEQTAIREVKEETGVKQIEIIKPDESTYHCYKVEDQRILKKTFWFEMSGSSTEDLVPQAEENISEVKWCNGKDLGEIRENTYQSLWLKFLTHIPA
ncbi:MAG: NUDIX domain-containing protein [Bacteroidetes bacterium]|nr:NUDIX domain-containing protein [Bacteroidota bacterium]